MILGVLIFVHPKSVIFYEKLQKWGIEPVQPTQYPIFPKLGVSVYVIDLFIGRIEFVDISPAGTFADGADIIIIPVPASSAPASITKGTFFCTLGNQDGP
jgi:hypothetical protein